MLFLFKQKTAFEMRINDWCSDVCSSDLVAQYHPARSEADAAADEPAQRPGARVALRHLHQESRRQQNAEGHRPGGKEAAVGDALGIEEVFAVDIEAMQHRRRDDSRQQERTEIERKVRLPVTDLQAAERRVGKEWVST